jgi:hypothetical protein
MPSENGNENWSALQGLLREISWEGKTVKWYRLGGQGMENVLTAEALQALDFLPRTMFLGRVIAAAHGADQARQRVIDEIESARVDLLPGPQFLARRGPGVDELVVQPDALLTSLHCYVLVEAKRIRRSSFQTEQLAREYALVTRKSKEHGADTPLLLLVFGEMPPVHIEKAARVPPEDSIRQHLASVRARCQPDGLDLDAMLERVGSVLAWVTWSEVRTAVEASAAAFRTGGSVEASVTRVADTALRAIDWHGLPSAATSTGPKGESS